VIRFCQLALGLEPVFEKVATNLSKEEALEIEDLLIREMGTLGEGTGPLANIAHTKNSPRARWRKSAQAICFEIITRHRQVVEAVTLHLNDLRAHHQKLPGLQLRENSVIPIWRSAVAHPPHTTQWRTGLSWAISKSSS
jgi:hypothetical protein